MWPDDASPPILGLGCMRLSTEPDRDGAIALAVLHAAFDAGVTVLDTADAYCVTSTEAHHNERLIAGALAAWSGDRSRIRVASKGGLTRPNGLWIPDGRARHLAAACEASLRALDVNRLALYQLHAPDPRTPLATSVRALDALKRQGLVDAIGLCNVTVGQIEEARAITDIAAVQVELSVWQDASLLNGVAAYCLEHDIRLLAYRPLGGPKRRRRAASDKVLGAVAARHEATPFEIALAWVHDLSPHVLPIPGATRVETIPSIARAAAIRLNVEDRDALDDRVPSARRLRRSAAGPEDDRRGGGVGGAREQTRNGAAQKQPRPTSEGIAATFEGGAADIVLIMGLPGAGKSTLARGMAADGYARLNRDEAGGSLKGLLPALDRAIESGASRIVLDNTYLSRQSRAVVVEAAATRGLGVRCLWLSTSLEDAQVNAVTRIVSRYGRLPTAEEMRAKNDVAVFGPTVQFRCQRELEPPHPGEGFSRIDVVPFVRRYDPTWVNKAVVLWCDAIVPERREVLRRYHDEGWLLCGLSWQPGIAEETTPREQVDAGFVRLRDQLGVPIEVEYCPHGGGPPTCWCRKPLPGLGVMLIHRHRLGPAKCLYVGNGPQDPGFARRLGFQYVGAAEFFGVR